MRKYIANAWHSETDDGVEVANILQHDVHPEGLDIARVRFREAASYQPHRDLGGQFSVLRGSLRVRSEGLPELHLHAGTHLYMPPGFAARLEGEPGAEIAIALAPTASRARGTVPLLRDDRFVAACALPGRSLRWILTPQYLSRRIFLHHDRTLLSKTGAPLSWFHTTMFDVRGLPANSEGRPVFKMSYNYRSEPNLCYQVEGRAGVRMALHPYVDGDAQKWDPWQALDGETTYHLNEDASQAEHQIQGSARVPLRNKHEVFVDDGFVSLICLFDPAPTGVECHTSGAYSSYGDLADTIGTSRYDEYLRALEPLDAMVQVLSLARARGEDPASKPEWRLYQEGITAQRQIEGELRAHLVAAGQGREQQLEAWLQP